MAVCPPVRYTLGDTFHENRDPRPKPFLGQGPQGWTHEAGDGPGSQQEGSGKGVYLQERDLSQTWPRAQSREDSGHRSQQGGLSIHVSAGRTQVKNQGGLRLMSQQEKPGNHVRVLEVRGQYHSSGRAGKIKLFLWLTSIKGCEGDTAPSRCHSNPEKEQ